MTPSHGDSVRTPITINTPTRATACSRLPVAAPADGRLWFRPAFVRAPEPDALPEGMSAVSLFGWTVGGVVALEYD